MVRWQGIRKNLPKKNWYQKTKELCFWQAEILSEKTGAVVYGAVTNMKFTPQDDTVKYNLATIFDIVVPNLDNYRYTLMILYSRPEINYPVAITVGINLIDDAEDFKPQCECYNRESFIEELQKILSSEEVNRNIEVLYSKASF